MHYGVLWTSFVQDKFVGFRNFLMQVFNFQVGLTSVGEKGKLALVQTLIQPVNGAYYRRTLLLPKLWFGTFNFQKSHLNFPDIYVRIFVGKTLCRRELRR